MLYAQPSSCPGEWDAQTSLRFWNTSRSPNLGQSTWPSNNQQQQQKRIHLQIVDFAVPTDHKLKLKESEKKDLARELKKLWNMKVTVIPVVIWALGTVPKGLVQGLEDLEIRVRVETIQTTALMLSVRILRRVLETWGDLLSLKI